jgi:dihydrofolate synthase/folylpolyglutamate synthase
MIKQTEAYKTTVEYLYGLRKYGIKLGLENSRRISALLGEPSSSFRAIHVAGTNGKGSTAIMLSSILKESNYRVGLFTSPHLASFTERIRINNTPISEQEVIQLTGFLRKKISSSRIKPTFFEFVTAMAFYYFACERVDWAVIEVGMGGRFDATNIINPEACIITNISLEHREYLGNTIPEIAFEKAGIIKDAKPVITAVTQPEAFKIIEDAANSHNAELHLYGRDFSSNLISMDEKSLIFEYIGTDISYPFIFIPLSGKYQMYNASVAIRTCEVLNNKGFKITNNAIQKGLSNPLINGRLEWLSFSPPLVIDSAHNPEAASALTETIKNIFSHKKIILVIGILEDKDIREILRPFAGISDTFIFTRPKGDRAAPPDTLLKLMEGLLYENSIPVNPVLLKTTESVEQALQLARTLQKKDSIILVTGSFYTTGEVKELMGQPAVFTQLRE